MLTTPSTPQRIDSYSIIITSGHQISSSLGKWGLKDVSLQKKRFLQNVLNYENDTLNISNNTICHSSNIAGQVGGGL
jgi:hypothetical protein